MYLTHNNHYEFGWGSGKFNFENMSEKFWMKFGKAEYIPTSFRSECVRAATLISINSKKPILILFSGGIDSEVVVRSFQEADVEFETLIVNFISEGQIINSHDTKWAYDYVLKNNIRHRVYDYDLDSFILNSLLIENDKFKPCHEWPILVHADIVEQFSDYRCVLGGGDLALKRHRFNGRNNKGLYLEEEPISVAIMNSARLSGGEANNRFFMHTPEQMLSWLLDHDVSHWIKYEEGLASKFGTINYHGIKYFCYFRHWPDIVARPKLTGFEVFDLTRLKQLSKLETLDGIDLDQKSKIIIECYKTKSENIIIEYEDLIKSLMP